jgi:molecular chaperone GrpE
MMSEIDPQTPTNSAETPEVVVETNPEPEVTEIQSDEPVTDVAARIAELTEQKDAAQNQYVRIAADFDNFRKRTVKEKEELELRIKCSTIGDILSVVDNFERARTQIKPRNDGETEIHKSYQGVYKQLVDTLKKSGVSPMRPEGQIFDPNLHEAVMRQPTEEHPEGTVIEELQRGYFLGEKILRHALVKVAAPIEQLSAEDAATGLENFES